MISTDLIKKLRKETRAGLMDVRKALEETKGDYDKAKTWLKEQGILKAAKKGDRETGDGIIFSYIHNGGKVGAMVQLSCETDFVAKTDDFAALAKEVAMQIASMDPKDVEDLLKQAYIRNPKQTVEDLIKETITKVGENIQIAKFSRMEI